MNLALAVTAGIGGKLGTLAAVGLLCVGMALSLTDILTVKENARVEARKAGVAASLRSLWTYMQQLGNPDLQLVFFSGLNAADKVIADVACKVYAIFILKPAASTTDAWLKGSNHATTAAANGDFVAYLRGTSGGGRAYCPVFHDGLPMGTGFTLGCHTTVNGNTKSAAADAATGFAIVGAP